MITTDDRHAVLEQGFVRRFEDLAYRGSGGTSAMADVTDERLFAVDEDDVYVPSVGNDRKR